MASGYPAPSETARRGQAAARIAEIRERLARPAPLPGRPVIAPPRPDLERSAYETMVRRTIDYILAGDIYQANITQRFSATLAAEDDPFALYCALRRRNPAPFAAYLRHGEVAIVSASPERFLKLAQGRVETRPIKGTRPRGATPGPRTRP
jgi:Anthranilate/para-aminobenzoate synthases component I